MKALIPILLAIALVGCGPSCEERGGKLVFSHTQLMLIGKGMYPVNQYRCEGAHDEP